MIKYPIYVIILMLLLLSLYFFTGFVTKPVIPSFKAREIAIIAAKPPKELIPRNEWELRQVSANVKPELYFMTGKFIKIYKYDVYYVDDHFNMTYYGRTVIINASNGKIIKIEKASETNY
ncbi:MAG: hypothetical protein KGZ63_04405 [Clostridiales bacterium]|nr:hypothetical protein [Clostridiales bacterium]